MYLRTWFVYLGLSTTEWNVALLLYLVLRSYKHLSGNYRNSSGSYRHCSHVHRALVDLIWHEKPSNCIATVNNRSYFFLKIVTVYISPFTLLACPLATLWLNKPLMWSRAYWAAKRQEGMQLNVNHQTARYALKIRLKRDWWCITLWYVTGCSLPFIFIHTQLLLLEWGWEELFKQTLQVIRHF